jgi:hypothetical protein
VSSPEAVIPTAILAISTATPEISNTETASFDFEIIKAEVLTEDNTAYKEYLRPGVNVRVVLSNLDPGYLPEEQLTPSNFCGLCTGWDNAGMEDGFYVVILHFYSWDLKSGENKISINAYGIQRQAVFVWEPPVVDSSVTSMPNPLGEFEILSASPVTVDDPVYKSYLRPGINIRVVLSNLDPGLLPEDQLRPTKFCNTCNGWDNAGNQDGYFIVVLHYPSSSMSPGENKITITGFGVTKEATIQYDPSIHLIK